MMKSFNQDYGKTSRQLAKSHLVSDLKKPSVSIQWY